MTTRSYFHSSGPAKSSNLHLLSSFWAFRSQTRMFKEQMRYQTRLRSVRATMLAKANFAKLSVKRSAKTSIKSNVSRKLVLGVVGAFLKCKRYGKFGELK